MKNSKTIIVFAGIFFFLAIIPLMVYIFLNGLDSIPESFRTLVDPPGPIMWFVIFLASYYYAKHYKKTFFETLKMLNLGPHTYELAKNSFISRRAFFVILVIFEAAFAFYFWLEMLFIYGGYSLRLASIVSLYVPIGILVIPLISRICSSMWSSALSIRRIIEQSVIDSTESGISAKVRERSSEWTNPFLLWIITTVVVGAFATPNLTGFSMIFLLTVLGIFVIVQIKNWNYIRKVKQSILKRLDETRHSWHSEMNSTLSVNYVPSQKEIDEAILSYETNLEETREQVRKIPTSFFHKWVIVILFAYLVVLPVAIYLIEVLGYGFY